MKTLLLALACLLGAIRATAQYSQTQLETGGYYSAVTVDDDDNVYVVRYSSNSLTYEVVKYVDGTGTPTMIYNQLTSGPNALPWGIAVNDNGDVFVTNPEDGAGEHWQIIKLAVSGGGTVYTPSTIQSGGYYTALAIAPNNDLLALEYVASPAGYRIMRYPAGNENAAGTEVHMPVLYPSVSTSTYPWGMALDAAGNIYVLDWHENNNGQIIRVDAPGYTTHTAIKSGGYYTAIAIDNAGNFYTTEYNGSTYRAVKRADIAQPTGEVLLDNLSTDVATRFLPWGLAVNSGGEVFVGDGGSSTGGRFVKLSPPGINVSSVVRANANPASTATVQYTVTFSSSATNVTAAAFTLTTTGVAGAGIASVNGSGTTYTVTVNTGTGSGTIRLDVNGTGISPTVLNAPYQTGEVYTIDKTAPTGAVEINSGSALTNNPNVTLGITATGADHATPMQFSNDDITYSAYEALAATKSWTLAAGDGLKTVYMQLRDAAGNVTTVQDQITLDQTAPETTIGSAPPANTSSTTATFQFSANETASFEVSLDGGPYTPATSPLTYTGLAAGAHTFGVRAIDQAGNLDGTPATHAWTVDPAAPVVASVDVPADAYYHEGDVLSFTVHFDENVNVVTTSGTPYLELTIGAATVQAAYTGGTGTNALTFSYTVLAGQQDLDGIALGGNIVLDGGTIQDAAGNNANLALNSVAPTSGILVYAITPTVTLSTTAASPVNLPFTVTVVFSEEMTGFALGDMAVTNAMLSSLNTVDDITYTMHVTPLGDGPVSIQVPANVAQNTGLVNNTASNTLNLDYDGTAPIVTSVNVPANGTYSSGDVLTFTINYSENVTVSGGTPSLELTIGADPVQALYTGGTGTNALTFSYAVADGNLDADGISLAAAIELNGATMQDAAANDAALTLAGVGNTSAVLVDAMAPVVNNVNVPANGYYKEGDVLSFTVQMSENVTVNTAGGTPYLELTIGAATVQAVNTGGSGTSMLAFSYTVMAGEQDLDGIVLGSSIVLNGGSIQDAAGNNAVLTLNSVPSTSGIFVYSVTPGVTLSTTAVSPVNQAFTVSVAFTEAVTGFDLGDINLANATASNLQTSDNITYTALITPAADGAVSLNVPAGAAQNIGNIDNTASNTLNLSYDGTAPAITSVDVPADGIYHNGDVLAFTVHYSENVNVSGAPYLQLTIGSALQQAAYTGGTGTSALAFSYTVQNGDLDMNGITIGSNLVLNSGALQDAAANNALLTLNSVGSTSDVWVNTIIPTVTLSGTPSPNTDFTLTITFSEAVTGFAIADFTLTNATVSNLQTSDNITYTVLVTPTADGAVSIRVPANAAQNAGANGNQASNVLSYTYDGTAPAITSVEVPAGDYYGEGETLDFTVHFTENVTVNTTGGTPAIPLTIGAAAVEAVYTGGTGASALTFRYTVQNGDMDMDGISVGGSLALNGSTLQDGAGNNAALALNNTGNTSAVLVNTQRPTVTLTAAATGRVNTPVTVTLVFSEAVTGLAAADISVTNGAAGNLQTTDNITYTADITPAADGAVEVSLPADVAENIGGNGNDASNTVAFSYDATAPLITAGQSFTVSQYDPVGTTVGQVAATEATGTLQDWTIATDGSGGAFEIDGTGALTVKDAAILSSLGGTTVTLNITVSDGLNTSTATPVTIQVGFVNQAPALDPITNVSICADTETHTLQLTGASATEPGQTYTITAAASQDVFDLLTVNASNVLSYQLKAGAAAGDITVAVTIKDDGGTALGGVDSLRRSFTITVNGLPVVSITSDKGTTVSKGETVMLTASGGDSYLWADADGIIGGQQSAVLEIRPKANTTYEVTATSAAGCTGVGSINIAVVDDFKVDATNILTPNGDGRNDRWVIRNIDSYPDNELKIFDRAGRMVYQRRNYSNDWDGTLNGNPLAEGTYYYILTINGGAVTTKGYITIVRDRQ